jgi:hypothetical protein
VDIWDKAGMDTFGKPGIAANITCNASLAARNTGRTVADTTGYNAFPPARNMDHTVPKTTHPKIGRNNRGHIPVPVHHGRLEQTNIKAELSRKLFSLDYPPHLSALIFKRGAAKKSMTTRIRSGVMPHRAEQENWRYCELNDVDDVTNVSFHVGLPTSLIMARTVPCKHRQPESLKRFAIRNLETGALCQEGSCRSSVSSHRQGPTFRRLPAGQVVIVHPTPFLIRLTPEVKIISLTDAL